MKCGTTAATPSLSVADAWHQPDIVKKAAAAAIAHIRFMYISLHEAASGSARELTRAQDTPWAITAGEQAHEKPHRVLQCGLDTGGAATGRARRKAIPTLPLRL